VALNFSGTRLLHQRHQPIRIDLQGLEEAVARERLIGHTDMIGMTKTAGIDFAALETLKHRFVIGHRDQPCSLRP
jgi:hypothetical protein